MIVFETSNGSNPPTRSLTGPKHVKLHKMLENTCKKPRKEPHNSPKSVQSAQIAQNPPKTSQILPQALQNPSQNPSQPPPKSLAREGFKPLGVNWRVLARFWKAQKLPQGSQTLPQTLQNGTKINEKSMQKSHYIFNVLFNGFSSIFDLKIHAFWNPFCILFSCKH